MTSRSSFCQIGFLFITVLGLTVLNQATAKITEEQKEQFFVEVKACVASTNLTNDEFESIVAKKEVPTSTEGKCFTKCILEKMEYITDGSLNVVGVQAVLEEQIEDQAKLEKAKKVVKDCNDSVKTSGGCEYAAAISECFYHKGKEAGLDTMMM